MLRRVWGLGRHYHSKRMRTHQSTIARLDNVFKPIESAFEDSPSGDPSSGSYARKRKEEQFTKAHSYITKYIEAMSIGSPRTSGQFKAMIGKKPLAPLFLDQMKPKVRFITSAIEEDQLPLATLPEIAVVGRSNSGKSSLVNAIVGTRCCQVVNKPGSTKELFFYKVGDPPLLSLVDVPGFGFAYADAKTRSQWAEFSLWYLRARRNLRLVLLVVDARHGFADSDLELISFFSKNKIDYRVIANKCDLVEAGVLGKRLTVMGADIGVRENDILNHVVPVSALRGQGIEKIRAICEKVKLQRDVVIAGKRRLVIDLLEERRLRKAQLRSDREARRKEELVDTFGDQTDEEKEKDVIGSSDEGRNCYTAEPDAYRPDAQSIIKRETAGLAVGTDIRFLEPENFVSKDEIDNLGLRHGGHRADLPAPVNGNTNYTAEMKLGYELGWKMKLDLGPIPETGGEAQPERSSERDTHNVSALGFISTFNPPTVPKGIDRWKVTGLKPHIKTSRFKARPETAKFVVDEAKGARKDTPKQKRRWGNSFTSRKEAVS